MHHKGMQKARPTARLHVLVKGSVVPTVTNALALLLKRPGCPAAAPFSSCLLGHRSATRGNLCEETSASLLPSLSGPSAEQSSMFTANLDESET